MNSNKLKPVALTGVASLLLASVFGATVAYAVLTTSSGQGEVAIATRAETAASITSSTTFADLPGASIRVSVPSGQRHHFTARFTAESQCFGAGAGICSVRIIVRESSGAFVELNPKSGLDFAFDSDQDGSPSDLAESHAMERSIAVRGGFYEIKVQRAVSNRATSFRLDDWHFSVETNPV